MPNNPKKIKANPGDRNEGKAKLAFPETAELGLGLGLGLGGLGDKAFRF